MAKEPFYLKKPFTTEEVRLLSGNGKTKLSTFIQINLAEMIENDSETVRDIIAERVHESGLLSDFDFDVFSIVDKKTIVLHVTGSVESILNSEDEDDFDDDDDSFGFQDDDE